MQYYKIDGGGFVQYIKIVNRYTKYSFFLGTPTEYVVYELAGFIMERINKFDDLTIICELTESEYLMYKDTLVKLNTKR